MGAAARQSGLFAESMRLQCLYCDREDADGVYEIPAGWTDVSEDTNSRKWFEGAWWTHSGICPDCSTDRATESPSP